MTYPDEPAAGPPASASPPEAAPAVTAPEGAAPSTALSTAAAPDAAPSAPDLPPLLTAAPGLPDSGGLPPVLVTAPAAGAAALSAGVPAPFPATAPFPAVTPATPATGPGVPALAAAAVAENGKRPRRRRWRGITMITLAVVGALLVAGGGVQLERELTRHATKAEAAQALSQEVASRWERLSAGAIFPATISYEDSNDDTVTARLVGISPAESCTAAVPAAELAKFKVTGCTTMLRATYTDAAGLTAATVGIGALTGPGHQKEPTDLYRTIPVADGLHAVGFPGTITAGFGDPQRAVSFIQLNRPYLFVYTAGDTDGEPVTPDSSQTQYSDLGNGILVKLFGIMSDHPSPCKMKDIKC